MSKTYSSKNQDVHVPEYESNIPASWVLVRFDDVCDVTDYVANGSFESLRNNVTYLASPSYAILIRLRDFTKSWNGNYVYVDEKAYQFLAKSKVFPGDLVVSNVGDPGKSFVAPDLGRPMTLGPNSVLVRPMDGVFSRYMDHFFASDWASRLIGQITTGTAQKKFNKTGLRSTVVPIPPQNEQVRIVEKLEELLSDLNAGVVELKAAQRKLAQYRQSLLKAAAEGALTAGWRAANGKPQETGADLLQRILSERRARWEQKQLIKFAEQGKTRPNGWEAKYLEPAAPDLGHLPSPPAEWTWTSLEHVADWSSGGTPPRSVSSYYSGSIPWFKTGELGPRILLDSEEHISEEALSDSSAKLFPSGSVAVAMYGATIGKTSILGVAGATNQACAVAIPDAVTSDFLYLFLLSQEGAFREAGKGGAQPNISQGIVKGWPICLPPRAEQNQIVSVVNGFLESMAELEQVIDRALRQSNAQRKNLLKAAFAGQLVPQDPNDEPASELLARIRAERAGTASNATRRRRKTA